jgi:D-alanyl-D-alanine carboxypeptidase (penicillin-binding protein 5/6)
VTPHTFATTALLAVLALPIGVMPATAPVSHAVADDIPCPRVDVTPPPPVPEPSPVPSRNRSVPAVGGSLLATSGLAVPDGAAAVPNNISARSWLVADLDSGEVLGACGPHEYGAPASLQKLLLAATVLPKLDPAATVTITPGDLDFEPGSSAVGLILGGTYTVETIWLGLMLNSGNDAANVLARLGGGEKGIAGTIDDMNAQARHLGADDTTARTPSGLDGPGQVTSAYDLALIFRSCFSHENFRRYTGAKTAQMPPQPPKDPNGFQIQNDNQLLFDYPGGIGGKTGFTDIARHTYVGAAERNGRRLVVTVLGAEHQPVKTWMQGAALLDWGFSVPAGHSVGHLIEPGEPEREQQQEPAAAATAQATPPTAPPLVRQAAQSPDRTNTMVGAAAAAAVFLSVWFGVARVTRRRGRHRSGRHEA